MELRPPKPIPEVPRLAKKLSIQRLKKKLKQKAPPPEFFTYEITQSKLDNAKRFLAGAPAPAVDRGCFGNVLFRQNASSLRSVNSVAPTLDMARFCAVRGMWPELMQTVAIQCEHSREIETRAMMRNAFYTILADPSLADPSFLRSYLLANPACRNEADVEFCIDKILEVFHGVASKPVEANKTRRRPAVTSGGGRGGPRKKAKRNEESREDT